MAILFCNFQLICILMGYLAIIGGSSLTHSSNSSVIIAVSYLFHFSENEETTSNKEDKRKLDM